MSKKTIVFIEKNIFAAIVSYFLFSLFYLGSESIKGNASETIEYIVKAFKDYTVLFLFLMGTVSSGFAERFARRVTEEKVDFTSFAIQILLTIIIFVIAGSVLKSNVSFEVLLMLYPICYYSSKKLHKKLSISISIFMILLFIITTYITLSGGK